MTNNHKQSQQSQQSSIASIATLTPGAPEAQVTPDITTVTALVASLPDRLGIGQSVTARARQRMGNVHSVSPDAIAYALRLSEERGSPVRFDREAARRYLDEEARLRPLREALAAAMARIDGHVLALREKPVRNTFGLFNALKVQSTFEHTAETAIALDGLREKIPVARKRGSRKKKEPTEPLSDRSFVQVCAA